MGVDQLFLGGLQIHGHDKSLISSVDFRTDPDGAPMSFAGFLVEDGLDQPLVLAQRNRLAIAGKRGTVRRGCRGPVPLPLLLLSRTERPLAGCNRCSRGNFQLVHRVDILQPGDLLDADHRLVLGLVGEAIGGNPPTIADGIDAL